MALRPGGPGEVQVGDLGPLALFAGGLLVLVAGGEALVRGAARIAERMGLSSLAIGLTVVAFGTSSPELAVTVSAALDGRADIAVGNVIGSNVFNILVVLGLSAALVPLAISQRLVRLEVPMLIGLSVLAFVLAVDREITRLDGAILIASGIAYTVFAVREARGGAKRDGPATGAPRGIPLAQVGLVIVGLALLVVGARWMVDGASGMARALGLSELVIGLAIVAPGTSLPEAATSLLALRRGERDMAAGNAIGSCVFNLLFVLGIGAVTSPAGLPVAPSVIAFDLPVMTAVALGCLPILTSGRRIDRWEGGVFLLYYAAYVAYLLLDASGHDALQAFSAVMLQFVLPLTVITVTVIFLRDLRPRRGA